MKIIVQHVKNLTEQNYILLYISSKYKEIIEILESHI